MTVSELVLVDTSVWVDHLRRGSRPMVLMLEKGRVLLHPLVYGELACGNIENRTEILGLLGSLPAAVQAEHREVLDLIEQRKLYGTGLGWVDLHLLASCLLSGNPLWTLDKVLHREAKRLGLAA